MPHLILLHGALGSQSQMLPLAAVLETSFTVHTLNFSGHGGEPLPARYSIPLFAEQVRNYIVNNTTGPVSIFGYSMGGYVAMALAKQYPGLVSRVATLATKYEWSASIAEKEARMLDPLVLEQKLPAFAASLKERHQPQDWKQVLSMTAGMMRELGEHSSLQIADFAAISIPALLMLGDRDKMVGIEETVLVYQQLKNAQLAVLPATAHPIEQVDVSMLSWHLQRFMNHPIKT